EVELGHGQQDAIVKVRAARHDPHVESVLPIRAVGERLIEAAVFRLREPIGAERDLIQRLGGGRACGQCNRCGADQLRSQSYCSKRSMNHLSKRVQISSLPTWSSTPWSRLGLSLTSITVKPPSISLMSIP